MGATTIWPIKIRKLHRHFKYILSSVSLCFSSKLYSHAFLLPPFILFLITSSPPTSSFLISFLFNVLNLILLFSLSSSSLPKSSSTPVVFMYFCYTLVFCFFLSVPFPLYFSYPTILYYSSTLPSSPHPIFLVLIIPLQSSGIHGFPFRVSNNSYVTFLTTHT